MTSKTKYRIVFFFFALTISLLINFSFYISQKSLHDILKNKGQQTQVYSKYLGSKGTPWYYGKPYALYYFVSPNGDTIKGKEPALIDGTYSSDNYLPTKKVLYDPLDPNKYMFLSNYNLYSDNFNKLMYFLTGTPICTIVIFFSIKTLLILLRKANYLNKINIDI